MSLILFRCDCPDSAGGTRGGELRYTGVANRHRTREAFTEMRPIPTIRLREREAVKDAGDMEIRPLTFLAGPNGVGKSAVLRELMERRRESGRAAPRYLGSFRTEPQRACAVREDAPESVGIHGEDAVAMLLANGARSEMSRRLLAKVNKWMRAFGMASEVNLRDAGRGRFAVELTNPNTGERANLADAGAGAIQALPIIVEGYHAPKGALILLEQPEARLHPRAQGTLGDLLIDIAKEGKALVVETHSELIINRVQTVVAEETLSKDDVAVYYFDPCEGGAQARELKLNKMGQMNSDDGIPGEFFSQGYEETVLHMNAVAKRIRRGESVD